MFPDLYKRKFIKYRRIFAAFLAVVLVILEIPIPTMANPVKYESYLDGWKVNASWSNLTYDYQWKAEEDTSKSPKIVVSYTNLNAEKDYPAGSLTFTVPGIGNVNRDSIIKASSVAADQNSSEWEYSWDETTDLYTFTNKFAVLKGESLTGGFEIIWKINARDCVNGFTQSKSPTFTISGAGSITLNPMIFTFTSARDRYRLSMKKQAVPTALYDIIDHRTYDWYSIENLFESDWLARGLYRSEYKISLNLPSGTDYNDVSVMRITGSDTCEEINLTGNTFTLFTKDGDLSTENTSYREDMLIGFSKAVFAGKDASLYGHLDRLYEDEKAWVTTAGEHETVDASVAFTFEEYDFEGSGFLGFVYSHNKASWGVDGSEDNRTSSAMLYNGTVRSFLLYGDARRNYDIISPFSMRSMDLEDENELMNEDESDDFIYMDEEYLPVGVEHWNDSRWKENGLYGNLGYDDLDAPTYAEIHGKKNKDENAKKEQSQIQIATDSEPEELEKASDTNAKEDSDDFVTKQPDSLLGTITAFLSKAFTRNENPLKMTAYAATPDNAQIDTYKISRSSDEDQLMTASVDEDEEYSLIVGDDHLAIYLNDGTSRRLEEDEYDFAYVEMFSDSYGYIWEVYGTDKHDTPFGQYRLLGSGNTSEEDMLMLPEGTKAIFVRVNDITGSYSFEPEVGVRLHLDWDAERSKPFEKRPDHNARLVNISYLRAMHSDGTGEYNAAETDKFYGLLPDYGKALKTVDPVVHGEELLRDYSLVYLREPVTQVKTETKLSDTKENKITNNGYTTFLQSSGTIHSESGVTEAIRKFSLYTIIPEGFDVSLDNGANITGYAQTLTGNDITNMSDYMTLREFEWSGQHVLAADFDFSSNPLNFGKEIFISAIYQTSLSYTKYLEIGNIYTASTYLMIQDNGIEQIKGPAIQTDEYDIDADSNTGEKMAISSHMVELTEDAEEWRGYVSKSVKSVASEAFVTDTTIRMFEDGLNNDELAETYYEYRLDFALGSNSATNLIFFDSIEQGASISVGEDSYTTIESEWQGTLLEVDTTYAEELGLVPTVYYSIKADQVFDLSDSGWSMTKPDNMAEVRSVAVSFDTSALSGGMLKMKQLLYVILKMQAPSDSSMLKKQAVNQYQIQYDAYGVDGTRENTYILPSSETRVTLEGTIGTVTLQKVDADNQTGTDQNGNPKFAALTGATFMVYDWNQTPLFESPRSVNAAGQIVLENQPKGQYYYEEITQPEGYRKLTGKQPFMIDGGSSILYIRNERIPGTLIIHKKDSDTDGTLSGAGFELRDSEGILIKFDKTSDGIYSYNANGACKAVETGIGGTATLHGLPWGNYTAMEKFPPSGYVSSNKEYSVALGKEQYKAETEEILAEITIENVQKTSSVRLSKTNSRTGEPVQGAVYRLHEVLDDGTEILASSFVKTNAIGELTINDLNFGSYYLKEERRPEGYALNTTPIPFEITDKNAGTLIRVTHTDDPIPGSISLLKRNPEGEVISGAEFSLYQSDGTLLRSGLTTNNSGLITVDNLDWTSYYFRETKAPKGYELSSDKIPFTIHAENAEYPVTVESINQRIRGTVKLTKMDEDKTVYLEGAVFTLYKTDGTVIQSGITTGTDGSVTIENLDWSSYYLVETSPPEGYALTDEKIRFSVGRDNCHLVQEIFCYDPLLVGSITIEKQIGPDQFNDSNGNSATFLYRITGVDHNGESYEWIREINLSGENRTGSTVIADVPIGNYTVKELKNGRYDLSNVVVNGSEWSEDDSGIHISVVPLNVYGVGNNTLQLSSPTVTFANDLSHYEKDSHSSTLSNIVKASKKLTSIDVRYTGPETITEKETNGGTEYVIPGSDVQVTAFYDDGTQKVLGSNAFTVNPNKLDYTYNGDSKIITVSYQEGGIVKTGTFAIDIKVPIPQILTGITATYNGSQPITEETISKSNFTVTASYLNNVKTTLSSSSFTVSKTSFTIADNGTQTVTISYTEDGITKTCTVKLTIAIPYLTGITASYMGTQPITGKTISKSNFLVKAIYSDGVSSTLLSSEFTVSKTSFSIADNGTQTVKVSYTEDGITKSANVTLTIAIPYLTGITATYRGSQPITTTTISKAYFTVKATYSDGRTSTLSSSKYTLSKTTFTVADNGTQTITVSYTEEGITKSADVNLTFDFYAQIVSGSSFNGKVKTLAAGTTKAYGDTDTLIKSIVFSKTAPSGTSGSVDITASGSPCKVYAYYTSSSGTITIVSDAPKVYLNKSSSYLCNYMTSLTNISGLSSLNTSKVTNLGRAFSRCTSLSNITPLSGWNVSAVTDLGYTFSYDSNLTSLAALSSWNVSAVTSLSGTFWECKALNNITGLTNWNTASLTNLYCTFYNCPAITSIAALKNWNVTKVTDMGGLFRYCTNLSDISPLSGWKTTSLTISEGMFCGLRVITTVSALSGWTMTNVTDMRNMFQGCYKLADISALANWNTSSCTDMKFMFNACYPLKNLTPLKNWNVSKVTTMESMFQHCSGLTDASAINAWAITSVTTFTNMFNGCSVHPTFSKRAGTWSNGTFNPS